MRIKVKKGVDRAAVGAAQAELDAKREFAAKEMQELRERRKAVGAKPGEGRVGGWHRDAVFNAVEQYGPEVLSGDAQGFWDDMKRLYPESCADDRVPGTDSMNGHGCKFGRVSKKFVGGRWYVWKNGKWVAEGVCSTQRRKVAETQRGGQVMIEVGQIIVAIGPRLYEVLKGKDCAKCAFQSEVREPCWCYCADFYSVTGGAHFKELDAVRSHNVLKFLEAQSQKERGK